MHKNSLANIIDTSKGFQKHPENINKEGRPRNPVVIAREKLAELLEDEYWLDNKEKEKTVVLILKDAIEQYLTSKNTREKQEWYKLIIGSSDNQAKREQPNSNAITAHNVLFLPSKQAPCEACAERAVVNSPQPVETVKEVNYEVVGESKES